ncbi:MAG: type III-B CRISPR module RAMP protein Cmr4 [Sulfolobaceae archaeon]|nr:type III-B CRISPR module RAMP protein Cmr4 [Sulfolobaceae archaeon]
MPLGKFLVLSYAISPVHVGAGRAPGAVDLPIQRDNIGYPIIFASSFKGVLKSSLLLDSNKDKMAKCLFGSEPEDQNKEMGRLVITDLIPVFYPIASVSEGYVYITTEYLLNRARDILEVLNYPESNLWSVDSSTGGKKEVSVLMDTVEYKSTLTLKKDVKDIGKLVKDKVYVFDDNAGLQFIESSIIRVYRNVLKDETKIADNLWAEEYLPHGTILIGGIIDGQRSNSLCSGINEEDMLKELNNLMVVQVGGRESIGKGVLKLKVIGNGKQKITS